jgi:hypothetical protein
MDDERGAIAPLRTELTPFGVQRYHAAWSPPYTLQPSGVPCWN